MNKKAILLIMDGWGLGTVPAADAILHANTPFVDQLYTQFQHTQLEASGTAVGLPQGQMGNSEVGHLNLGAGRIVYQELQRINLAIESKSILDNKIFQHALEIATTQNKKLHFIGLVSDGGVHSHINHLKGLIAFAEAANVPEYYIHAFTDGRDCDPKSGLSHIQDLSQFLEDKKGKIASVTGRFYAMDRDKRWNRIALAYQAMVHGQGALSTDILSSIELSYQNDITDEFIEPIIHVDEQGQPIATIADGDIVICFNFRTDRCREITEVLTQMPMTEFDMQPLALNYYTMTEYDKTYINVHPIFETDNLTNTLGEVLAAHGKKQIRIAETEKYPHVTFFFSGGRETVFEGEKRIICPSPKDVSTYDQKPEMSAYDITKAILPEIEQETADFICLNFANTDMVGHTGVWSAVIQAAETVDFCVSKIVPVALEHGYTVFLTADHGNSDFMLNEDGSPNTAHSLNKVPLILIDKDYQGTLQEGKLGDIAPTILHYLGLPIPAEMTGNILTN